METYETYTKVMNEATFHGTNAYHKCGLGPVYSTDGALWVFEQFQCFWLHDKLAIFMLEHPDECFMVATIKVENQEALITYDDGNENVIATQKVEFTDMPEGEYEFWLANAPSQRVIYLRTEH